MRGRKPKPTTIHKLNGNPGKRKLNDREPVPPALAGFDVPAEIANNASARREWLRLAPMLKRVRQITEADRASLIACCLEWSNYIQAKRRATPAVRAGKPNPWRTVQRQALAALMKLWPELGLTPSSRTRIQVADVPAMDGDGFSEFDDAPKPTPAPTSDPRTH